MKCYQVNALKLLHCKYSKHNSIENQDIFALKKKKKKLINNFIIKHHKLN